MQSNKHCFKYGIKALTLIELLIVLAIIAVIGNAIVGRMLSGIERAKLLAAGRQLVAHIRLAQERAKLEQRNYTVEFDAENEVYKIYQAGLSFDGVDDYVSFTPSGFPTGNALHSIEAWIYVNALPSNRAWILLLGPETTGAHHWLINSTGGTQFGVWGGAQTQPLLSVGSWTHVVITYDGTNIRSYVNGTLSQTVAIGATPFNLTQALDLARGHIGENYFNGRLSEVRIYNRALTPAEISYSYTYKKPMNRAGLVGWWKLDEGQGAIVADSSGYGNTGIIHGARWSQGVLGHLKDPAKSYQDINYDLDNLSEFKGVTIHSVNF